MIRKISIVFASIMCISILTACNSVKTDSSTLNAAKEIAQSKQGAFNLEKGTVTLNNGVVMPALGLGTFTLSPAQTEESVYNALITGVRLIDTANAYMNERAVGRGIKRSGVPREDIFITTKLWPSGYEDAAKAIDETLTRLDLEYIDLLLLHQPFGNYTEGYRAMEIALKEGKIRSIGLSNFFEERFDEIMNIATIPPAVLQIELNPFVHQSEMREYIKPYGTVLNAWFPLGGRGNTQTMFNNEIIAAIAQAHGKTSAQVVLRWHLQAGSIAIPGSSNANHIRENFSIFDFELTDEEMHRIKTLDRGQGSFEFRNLDGDARFSSFTAPRDFNDQE